MTIRHVMNRYEILQRQLENLGLTVWRDRPLSACTTIGIGGPASLFIEVTDSSALEACIRLSRQYEIPYQILGNGSNIIVSDAGFDGLVVVNKTEHWKILGPPDKSPGVRSKTESRFKALSAEEKQKFFSNGNESLPDILIRVDSGLKVNTLMQALYRKGISGLQWFAGIPASVGGAIYMNMHGAHYYFGDLVYAACLTDGSQTRIVDYEYFQFDYDWSLLHRTGEIVLWADLCLKKGGVSSARRISKEWSRQKSFQPQKSAGCIFRNISPQEQNN